MSEITNNNEYILLYHHGKDFDIKKFMERNSLYGITPKDFFDDNKSFIFTQMSEQDKENYKTKFSKWPENAESLDINMILPSPCNLRINPSKVTAELSISQTNAQANTSDFYAFANEKIQDILQNSGYKIDSSTKRNPDCSVFGWFKSLYYLGLNSEDKSYSPIEFADLSRYVVSLATSVGANGGSFTLRLPIINGQDVSVLIGEYAKNEKGEITKIKTKGQLTQAIKRTYNFGNNEYLSKTSFDRVESNYFNWLISSNDLLFISFEKLDMEKIKIREINFENDEDNFQVSSLISQGVFDMIALVDDIKVVTNAPSSEAFVEITGRDLMKLLIEDGSFFFNPSTTSDPSTVFANEQSYGKQGDVREADMMNNTYNNPINRLRRITGEIDVFSNRMNMDIDFILKGVMSQLANVEIVPSYVFESWGNDRTKYIELIPKDKK